MPVSIRDFFSAQVSAASSMPPMHRRRRSARMIGLLALGLTVAAKQLDSQTIQSSVIAGGGGRSASSGKCFRLDATIAQPLASVASGGIYMVTSGFLPGRGDNVSIFNYGFEVCS